MGVVDAATAQELRLADGRSAVLAGIVALGPAGPGDQGVPDRSTGPSRSTGMAACAVSCGVRTVPGCRPRWSSAGWRSWHPAADVAPDTLAELLRLERDARAAAARALGRPAAWGRIRPERVAAAPGAFVLVRGMVREVSRRYDLTYLDFGADWRRDFTVRAETRQPRRLCPRRA